jgi:FtsP/CotA-like multicopper oxidase with cupredoxin domain
VGLQRPVARPTIEWSKAIVRIYVTNRLPKHTTIHWHGQRGLNGMDNRRADPATDQAGQDFRVRIRRAPPAPYHHRMPTR